MDDTPTESILTDLESSDAAEAVDPATALVARLETLLADAEPDAAAPSA